jgi:hypothetical protein
MKMTQVNAFTLSPLVTEHSGRKFDFGLEGGAPMRVPLIVATALAGMAFVAAPPSASAAPLGGVSKNFAQQAQMSTPSVVQQVQRRGRGGRVVRGGGGRRGGGGGGNVGAAAAGAAIGLAIGAIIASEAARQQNAVEYCMRRYRSYNPQTGIWIDRHGRAHRCP